MYKKIVLLLFLSIFIMIYVGENHVSAHEDREVSEEKIDLFLKERDVPDEVLSEITYLGKLEIYNTLDKTATFDEFSSEDVVFESDSLEYTPYYIPKSELELKVSGFKNSDGTYTIYPSFIWKTKARLKNDTFGFALDRRNWNTVAGNVGLNVYMRNITPGYHDSIYYDRATESNYAGHAFTIPSGQFYKNHLHYEGHAHFKAKPKSGSVDRRIILRYGDHTGGALSNVSYSVSVGIFNVTIPSPPSDFRQTTETLSW